MTVAPGDDALRIADRLAITALNDGFGACLDHGDRAGFLDLFTDDVEYSNGPRRLQGRAELAAFFDERARAGRVSRHLYSGLRIAFAGPDTANGHSVWLTFAGAGAVPIQTAEPFLVADVVDDYRLQAGVWRIGRRSISPVFRNPGIAAPVAATPPDR